MDQRSKQDYEPVPTFDLTDNALLHIERCVYTQTDIDQQHEKARAPSPSLLERFFSSCLCSSKTLLKRIPIIDVIRHYNVRQYMLGDLLSGLSAASLHFPQGLAFGLLASLSPAAGLYTSFFPIVLYMIFGTSPHVSFGANAVIALTTAALVDNAASVEFPWLSKDGGEMHTETNSTENLEADVLEYKLHIAAGASCLCGIILVVFGVLRLGFLTSYLSTSFIGGFTTGAAIHIFSSQISHCLGIHIPHSHGVGKLIYTYRNIFAGIHNSSIPALVSAIITAIILVVVKDCVNKRYHDKMRMPIPIDFLVVIVAAIISSSADLNGKFGIKICGDIPRGIPSPFLPYLKPTELLFPKSLELALLIFFLTIAMAKLCAEKHDYEIDDNQELIAYGLSNLGSSFFRCFPSCLAPPRTMVLSMMGAKTTLNAFWSAAVVLCIILVAGQLFTSLPIPVLAAMVMVAIKDLMAQVGGVPRLFRRNVYDGAIWTVTCLAAVLLDLVYGLLGGVIVSWFVVVLQSQRRRLHVQEQVRREYVFLNTDEHDHLTGHPEIKIVKPGFSLYFATTELFCKSLYTIVNPSSVVKKFPKTSHEAQMNSHSMNDKDTNDTRHLVETGEDQKLLHHLPKCIIINLCQASYIDTQGVTMLQKVYTRYQQVNVSVLLCECQGQVREMFEKTDFYQHFARECVYFGLEDAYEAARLAAGTETAYL